MKKLLLIVFVGFGLMFVGCGGGSSSSSTFDGTLTNGDGQTFKCTSQSAFDACNAGNCGQCTQTAGPSQETTTPQGACTVNGNTVIGTNGQTCTHNGHTVRCAGGKLTLDSALTIEGSTTINGVEYTCGG